MAEGGGRGERIVGKPRVFFVRVCACVRERTHVCARREEKSKRKDGEAPGMLVFLHLHVPEPTFECKKLMFNAVQR